jgi:ADP-ribose pyrophosphatase
VDGFRRVRARGESFPILVPKPGAQVDGLLIEGLSAADVARLCFFENGYVLNPVQVAAGGRSVSARFFSHTEQLAGSGDAWVLETWRSFDKPLELTAAARWMAGFQDNDAKAVPLPEAA